MGLQDFLGIERQLGPIPGMKLFHDLTDMHLDRVLRHAELEGDHLVWLPLLQAAQNLELPAREPDGGLMIGGTGWICSGH